MGGMLASPAVTKRFGLVVLLFVASELGPADGLVPADGAAAAASPKGVARSADARGWGPPHLFKDGKEGLRDLPSRLTNQEFWRLVSDSSEPGGYFRGQDITNLTSNELWFQYVIPDLVTRARQNRVYLGVGPEQNFTYMAALKPTMAIIFDIRRGNLDLQLMYKAIFELSKDRGDFVSMLFSKPRPTGLGPSSTADQLFTAFSTSGTSEPSFTTNLAAIENQLTKTHGFELASHNDLAGVRAIYQTFYWSGFNVRPSPNYVELMTATDATGLGRSYLASEADFNVVKDLESRNLVIPIVGDFGGPKAIRAVAAYLKSIGGLVSAFYLSNVEQYLYQEGKWDSFCRNVAALPLDETSTFIRSSNSGGFGRGGGFVSSLGAMADEVKACARQP